MPYLRFIVKLSVVIVCGVCSFGGVAGFMAAKTNAAPLPISKPDPIAAKLAEDSDLTGARRVMSPIFPTAKYTHAQLAAPAKKVTKSKIAKYPLNKMPMQLVYSGKPQVVAQAGPVFAKIR